MCSFRKFFKHSAEVDFQLLVFKPKVCNKCIFLTKIPQSIHLNAKSSSRTQGPVYNGEVKCIGGQKLRLPYFDL